MSKQIYKIKDFSGGLNSLQVASDISNNQVSDAKSIMFHMQGSISPSYIMTDSTNNSLGATYANTNVDNIEPGYGLGYFETDHQVVTGTTLTDVGSGDISDIDGFVFSTLGQKHELVHYIGHSVQNLAASFPVGSEIAISNLSGDGVNGVITGSNEGIFKVTSHSGSVIRLNRSLGDTDYAFSATLTSHPQGDKIILLANPSTHKVDVFSETNSTTWANNVITLCDTAQNYDSKVKFYKAGDSIRVCDTSSNSASSIKWYGWISRTHFIGTDNPNIISSFKVSDNKLLAPTSGAITNGGTSGYPNSGTGFSFSIASDATTTGIISSAIYEFAQTFIYDSNQESIPFKYSSTYTVTDANDLKALSVNIGLQGNYDDRISGGRIYIRENNSGDEWTLLIDIDLQKGCRTNLSEEHTVFASKSFTDATCDYNNDPTITHDDDSGAIQAGYIVHGVGIPPGATVSSVTSATEFELSVSTIGGSVTNGTLTFIDGSKFLCPDSTSSNNFIIDEFNLLNYEILNGFPSSIYSIAIGKDDERWQDSTIANNRVFICNVTITDENKGSTTNFRDRIMYSMPGRYDTFPYFNFIEASKGDADHYMAIESFGDRILAFKRFSLDIINIASPNDYSWFMEDTKKYMGIENPELVKNTQYGAIWANENGLFKYDGSKISNLSENLISDINWYNHIGSNSCIIYDERESQAFIIQDMNSDGDAYLFDLKKDTFTFLPSFASVPMTNSVDVESGQTYIGKSTGSQTDFYQLYRSYQNTSPILYQSKEIDFGDPNINKRFYAVYMTFKTSTSLAEKVYFSTNEGATWVLISGGTSTRSTTSWIKGKWALPSPVFVSKVMIKVDIPSTSAQLWINDIGLEFRPVHKRMA